MGKAVCCDRCGRFEKVPPLSDKYQSHDWLLLTKNDDPVGDGSGKSFLCPQCAVDFDRFMVTVVRET